MKLFFSLIGILLLSAASAQVNVSKKDRRKDVLLHTTAGNMVVRLSDSTPAHRDNFLLLVKKGYYDSLLFHRVIEGFMIQTGDPNSKLAPAGQPLGNGGPGYTVPAEMRPGLYHKKGAVAAARLGDQQNPTRASSGSQFYIVQGRTFTEGALDSITVARLDGRKIPEHRRAHYRELGGTPQLDGNYTVFGEVVKGLEVIDKVASTPTSKGADRDRPLTDVRILKATLIKRDKKLRSEF